MNNYKVYIHKFPNGKAYIGITRQEPKLRWGECCNKVPKYNTAGGYRWEYADK